MLDYEQEYGMVYLCYNFVIMLANNDLDDYYHLNWSVTNSVQNVSLMSSRKIELYRFKFSYK